MMEFKIEHKQGNSDGIPEDWDTAELRDLTEQGRGIRYGIVRNESQPGAYEPGGRLMIRGKDYSDGWVGPSKMFRVSESVEAKYTNARVGTGDVIMTIVGASTGHVESVPPWLDGANLTQTTARIAIDSNLAEATYCKYALQGKVGQKQVEAYIKGGAQPGLNCGDIERFEIPLPPRPEQRAIADALSDVDALIERLDALIAKKRAIKTATMQRLLTGQQRLPGFSAPWTTKRLGI